MLLTIRRTANKQTVVITYPSRGDSKKSQTSLKKYHTLLLIILSLEFNSVMNEVHGNTSNALVEENLRGQ